MDASPRRYGETAMSVAAAVMLSLVEVGVVIYLIPEYSLALFAATPFTFGLISALFYGILFNYTRSERIVQLSMTNAYVVLGLAGVLIVMLAVEGIICVFMAAPLFILFTFLGAQVGAAIIMWVRSPGGRNTAMLIVLTFFCGTVALDRAHAYDEPWRTVATEIEIDAPPDVVWGMIVETDGLPEPSEWLFRLGVACPHRAQMVGEGVGAARYCELSTGTCVQRVTAWEPGKLLRVDIISEPPSMKELSPWPHLHPPHLEGFLVCKEAEYRFTHLANGGTRVARTTTYRHGLEPAWYWRWWSDYAIEQNHERVLRHVKRQAESGMPG